MALQDFSSVLAEKTQYLSGDDKRAFLAGALVGVRLARKLIAGQRDGTWNTGLNALGRETFMGELRSVGVRPEEFLAGVRRGSYGAVLMTMEELPFADLMAQRRTGMQYAYGMFDAVDVVYVSGTRHFDRTYGREEAAQMIMQWVDDKEAEVQRILDAS